MTNVPALRARAERAEAQVERARRWIETCVDPVAVGPARKQAMLDYLDDPWATPPNFDTLPRGDEEERVSGWWAVLLASLVLAGIVLAVVSR